MALSPLRRTSPVLIGTAVHRPCAAGHHSQSRLGGGAVVIGKTRRTVPTGLSQMRVEPIQDATLDVLLVRRFMEPVRFARVADHFGFLA
jgi:hypothetical protein